MAEMQDLEVETIEIEASELEAQEAKDKQAAIDRELKKDDLLEKYREMPVEEVVNLARHDRKIMGQQANELSAARKEISEIRKLADELITSHLQKKPEPEPVKEVDFFENPQEAIRRAVESNPRVVAAEQYGIQAQKMQAQQRLQQLHPDFGQIVQDGEFATWIKASKVRNELFQRAEAYDVDAADELLSTFKQLKTVKTERSQVQVSDEEKSSRTKTLQAAAVDTGGSGESSKKVYRRADLIRLKMRDPAKYEDMADEILAAYSQGRVR